MLIIKKINNNLNLIVCCLKLFETLGRILGSYSNNHQSVYEIVIYILILLGKLSRRSITHEYFINEGEGKRKVSQQFLIATLDVTQRDLFCIHFKIQQIIFLNMTKEV